MKIRCVQCGREFELSQNEIDFYYSKGLDLPKRCKSCRDKNSGKYIVTYSEKHSVNLFFFVIFLALAVAVAYFDFAAHTFTGVWPIIIMSASALISIIANGDTVYYNKKTEDYVVLARAGYIRSYYKASYNHYLKQ